MTSDGNSARPPDALAREEARNVTTLFGARAGAAERQQSWQEVVQERDALLAMFAQAPGYMALLEGPEHRYTFSNAANNRLLGRGDLVGKSVVEAFPELAEQGIAAVLDRVYASGEPYIGNGLTFEIREHPTGLLRQRIVNFVYQPIRAAADAPVTGIFVEGHDVTELHESHARIQAQHMELIHVSRVSAMGTMASTVAHELNQPLTAITSYLSAASRIAGRGEADPQLDRCLASAQEVAQRAGKILRFLRDMTLSAIEISPVFEVDDAVRQAVELARASHPNMDIAYDIEPGATAKVDRIQFQQVMLNLLRNAQEACGEGPCRVTITVTCAGAFLEVVIADNGTGFSEEELPKVFEALVTTKPRGMGVGLSVCRTIIETYGGRISAHNGPDGGAMVRFTIPAESGPRRPLG
jgi:two-component system sensor kinase FixL